MLWLIHGVSFVIVGLKEDVVVKIEVVYVFLHDYILVYES